MGPRIKLTMHWQPFPLFFSTSEADIYAQRLYLFVLMRCMLAYSHSGVWHINTTAKHPCHAAVWYLLAVDVVPWCSSPAHFDVLFLDDQAPLFPFFSLSPPSLCPSIVVFVVVLHGYLFKDRKRKIWMEMRKWKREQQDTSVLKATGGTWITSSVASSSGDREWRVPIWRESWSE
jgi:hypothetical protein